MAIQGFSSFRNFTASVCSTPIAHHQGRAGINHFDAVVLGVAEKFEGVLTTLEQRRLNREPAEDGDMLAALGGGKLFSVQCEVILHFAGEIGRAHV